MLPLTCVLWGEIKIFGACPSPASHPTRRRVDRDVERDVQPHELGCQKVLSGSGSASDRGPWRPSDARPPSAQDAGLRGTAIFRPRVVRSDGGDRRPQSALRPCPCWTAGWGAAPARPWPGTRDSILYRAVFLPGQSPRSLRVAAAAPPEFAVSVRRSGPGWRRSRRFSSYGTPSSARHNRSGSRKARLPALGCGRYPESKPCPPRRPRPANHRASLRAVGRRRFHTGQRSIGSRRWRRGLPCPGRGGLHTGARRGTARRVALRPRDRSRTGRLGSCCLRLPRRCSNRTHRSRCQGRSR
jgi:hypothetical protein